MGIAFNFYDDVLMLRIDEDHDNRHSYVFEEDIRFDTLLPIKNF